ncbi:cell wall-binding repeat-containing protein [Clostridium sp. DJ247]|uniref:cell wall-binding repeat-containing protein n=1 Tax=Clostridium sp. DJ247 TaxID=2726188 RepID=UPI001625D9F8|nr:cell wall-binding repeat-containing protein [Clostridium sp. DJ247]MBC2580824.1 cell wall-binding repeat-containing protein [Clostridium sp. DJ247]
MKKTKLLVMSVILGTSLLFSTNVFAKNNINLIRLSGSNRYDTSSAIVTKGWTQSDYAILVNSQNFPDAITSSPLAKKYNAPILLTDPNALTDSTKQKLQQLGVKNVFIIGGTGVVSNDVGNTLEGMGISTKRIWGQDRYETSVNVAKELGTSKGVFVVSGQTWEDALSVAPIADKLSYPIILTGSNQVSDTVINFVNNQVKANNGEVNVVGGTDTINSNVVSELNPTKVFNQSTKYDRNLALINNYKDKLDLSNVYMASDKGFADALSGSALAGLNGNPIILVGDSNQGTVNNFVNNGTINVNIITALGGSGVMPDNLVSGIINGTATNVTNTSPTMPVTPTTTPSSNVSDSNSYKQVTDTLVKISDEQAIEDNFDNFYKFTQNDTLQNTLKTMYSELKDNIDSVYFQVHDTDAEVYFVKNAVGIQANGDIGFVYNKATNSLTLLLGNVSMYDKNVRAKVASDALNAFPDKYKLFMMNDILIGAEHNTNDLTTYNDKLIKAMLYKQETEISSGSKNTVYGNAYRNITVNKDGKLKDMIMIEQSFDK